MINEIRTEAQYKECIDSIERIIEVATGRGGFDFLSEPEKEELARYSLMAEDYEDEVLKIMPFIEL